jgi:hypothetical protein
MKLIKTMYAFLCISFAACAQNMNTPIPPDTPKTNGSSHTEVVTSSSRISSSTSISDANTSYKFRSKFHSSKREGIENILKDALEGISFKKRRNNITWEILQEGELLFECSFSKSRLLIYVDKKEATRSFYRKIKKLGERLQEYISAHRRHRFSSSNRNSISRAEERLERAKKELERSIRNLEEVRRENEK